MDDWLRTGFPTGYSLKILHAWALNERVVRKYCLNIADILQCSLVNVTFSLPDDTVKRLREAARHGGRRRKGAISEIVDAAVRQHLLDVESKGKEEEFRALRGDKVVARAGSLRELASMLERRKINPREVLVVSSSPLEPSVRTGLRRSVG